MRKDCISLWKFKNIINKAWKNRDGATGIVVMFCIGDKEYDLDNISQFQVIPDVTIHLKEKKV